MTAFVGLYTQAIGDWSSLLVSVAALAVMYSTLLAIVDGFPRMMGEFAAELLAAGREETAEAFYFPAMLVVVAAASALLLFFFSAFAAFIDIVTFTGFSCRTHRCLGKPAGHLRRQRAGRTPA